MCSGRKSQAILYTKSQSDRSLERINFALVADVHLFVGEADAVVVSIVFGEQLQFKFVVSRWQPKFVNLMFISTQWQSRFKSDVAYLSDDDRIFSDRVSKIENRYRFSEERRFDCSFLVSVIANRQSTTPHSRRQHQSITYMSMLSNKAITATNHLNFSRTNSVTNSRISTEHFIHWCAWKANCHH